MDYRRDIDGLRTIAVMLVVLDHAGFHTFSGGYTGVDVFFVISGYLITGIIYNKTVAGEFSFSNFYVRRIRRLMPALFVMLGVTTVVFSQILLPGDLVKFGQSVFWVSLYVGNFFFWQAHGGYFGGNAQEAPLLHTWSLAVEEQYYLLWPIYIVLGLRFLSQQRFILLSVILLLALTWFSEFATTFTIGAAYYLLPTRFFELMMGSIIAMSWHRLPQVPGRVAHVSSLIGIGLIMYGALTLDGTSNFPGYNALYPTVGTALIILSNRDTPGIVNRILSWQPIVFVGLLSYSLYLWHWPIFVYMRYTAVEFTLLNQLAAIGLAFILAYLSWRFVEQPVRQRRGVGLGPTALRWFVLPVGIAASYMAITTVGSGYPQRFDENILAIETGLQNRSAELRAACHSSLRQSESKPVEECFFGVPKDEATATALLFGDSHANHVAGFVDVLAAPAGVAVQDYTLDQCPPIFGLEWGESAFKAKQCKARNDRIREYLAAADFDYAVLSASWPSDTGDMAFRDGRQIKDDGEFSAWLEESITGTIQALVDAGVRPIVMLDVSWVYDQDPRCPLKRAAFDPELVCTFKQLPNQFELETFAKLADDYPELIVIAPDTPMCSDGICELALDGIPLYFDDNHLTDVGARELARRYLLTNPNPLEPANF